MDENNLEEISGIREVESMGGGDMNGMPPQSEQTAYDIPQGTFEEPGNGAGGNKGPVILLIATIVVLLGAVVFGVMSFSKSKTEKFFGLFADDYMFGMLNEANEMMMKDGKLTTEISLDPSDFSQFTDEDITIKRLAWVSEQVTDGADFSGKVYLDVDSTELITAQYAKTEDMFGLTVPGLMNEYFVVKNENLKELARKFGASEEEIAQIPDKLTVEEIEKLLETENVDSEKYLNILEKYIKPISNAVEANLVEEKQDLEIKESVFKTKRHSLELTEKDLYELAIAVLEIAKDDEDLYNAIKEAEPTFEPETFEEWKDGLNQAITKLKEKVATANDLTVMFRLSAYVAGKDTMAIEVAVPKENIAIKVVSLNEKKSAYTEVIITAEDGEIKVILTANAGKNEYVGDIKFAADMGAANLNIDIAEYKIKYTPKAEIEKLDTATLFVLNDESEESIKNKITEIQENMPNYITALTEKAPESLKTMLSDVSESDHDYSHEYDDYENEAFEIKGTQVYVLPDSNKIYESIKIGMTKEEVISLMGTPDYNETFGDLTFLDWEDEHYNRHSAIIENDLVVEKSRDLTSASYKNIQLSTELGTEIENLEETIKEVAEEMTLKEVENILGDKYFEQERSDLGEVSFRWYDKAENFVDVSFDEEGKVWYIGDVWGSY